MEENFKRISRIFIILLLVVCLPFRVFAADEVEDKNTSGNSTEISSTKDERTRDVSKEKSNYSSEKSSENKVASEDTKEKSSKDSLANNEVVASENNSAIAKLADDNKNLSEEEDKLATENSAGDKNEKAEENSEVSDDKNAGSDKKEDSKDSTAEDSTTIEEKEKASDRTEDNNKTEDENKSGEKDKSDDQNKSDDKKELEDTKKSDDEKNSPENTSNPEETKNSEEKTEENKDNTEEKTEENKKNIKENKDNKKEESENKFDISIISDTHILPEDMIGENEDYEIAKNSDRKLFTESIGLLKAALKKIDEKGSKYIFVPGDLTKDGEYEAHKEFVKILSEWKNAKPGREVFIVPGNHDINNKHAYDFSGSEKKEAKRTDPDDFMEIYKDFVYANENLIDKYKDSSLYKEYLEEVNKKYNRNLSYAQGYESYVVRVKNEKGEDKNGLTLIGLDTTIHSAESTKDHSEIQETEGRVTLPLIKWLVSKVDEANSRNDVVTVMSHHAFLPHFDKQEKLLSPYIIKEWDTRFEDSDERINGKTPSEILANLGVRFLFTGHLHAQDVAKYDDGKGNVFYDIQTGSLVTYPLPVRHITIENNISKGQDYTIDMKTDLIDSFTYTDPATGEKITVDDAMKYASKNQLTPELVAGLVNYYLDTNNFSKIESKKMIFDLLKKNGIEVSENAYGEKIIKILGDKFLTESKKINAGVAEVEISVKPIENTELYGKGNKIAIDTKVFGIPTKLLIRGEKLEDAIDNILNQVDTKVVTRENLYNWSKKLVAKMMDYPIYTSEDGTVVKTLSDIANDSYKAYLKGDEVQPAYIKATVAKYSDPNNDLVRDLLEYASGDIEDVLMDAASKIEYKKEGLSGAGNDSFKFINNLIEGEKNPDDGQMIKAFLAQMIGKNVAETLKNSTIQGMLAKQVYGKETDKKKVEAKDLVNMVYDMGPVENLLSKLANSFGAKNITELAVGTVDGMTNENNGKYKYYFQPDNTYKFEVTVNTEGPGNINLSQDKNLDLSKDISDEYKLKDTKVFVNGEERQIDKDNLEEAIKKLEKDLKNNDEVSLVMTLTNKFGNVFELESKITYSKEEPKDNEGPKDNEDPKDNDNGEEKPEVEIDSDDFTIINRERDKESNVILLNPIVTLDGKNIQSKNEITLTFKNFKGYTVYFIYLDGQTLIGKITTDASGFSKVDLKIPEGIKEGSHLITIKDENGNTVYSKYMTLAELKAA